MSKPIVVALGIAVLAACTVISHVESGREFPNCPDAEAGTPKQRLSDCDVMMVILRHKSEIAACARGQPEWNRISGRLVLQWTVLTSGATSDVSVLTEEYRSTYLADCLVARVKTWTFPEHEIQREPIHFPFLF